LMVHPFVLLILICLYFESVNSQVKCGVPCSGPNDCTSPTDNRCTTCRLGKCVGPGGCGNYCNPDQPVDQWCYNGYCTSCDRATSKCLSDCGGACMNAGECIATSCSVCSPQFRCVRSCSSACTTDSDCASNVDGCTKCTASKCQRPTGCAAHCISNSDCIQNTDGCTKCVRNQCVTGGCASICYYTPDCIGQGNCTQCFGRFEPGGYGLCTGSCTSPCGGPEQCNGTLTNCGQCLNGVCSPASQCGITCQNDAGCALNCHRCIGGICTANAKCGEDCNTDTDCDINTCRLCTNKKCTSPFGIL